MCFVAKKESVRNRIVLDSNRIVNDEQSVPIRREDPANFLAYAAIAAVDWSNRDDRASTCRISGRLLSGRIDDAAREEKREEGSGKGEAGNGNSSVVI